MTPSNPRLFLFVVAAAAFAGGVRADEKKAPTVPCAAPVDDFFVNEVWAKVGAPTCLKCHTAEGEALNSKFILKDPERSTGRERDEAMRHNRDAFGRMARLKEGDQSRLLLKVVGELKHGGKAPLKPDSAGYKVLVEFVRRLNMPVDPRILVEDKNAPPFFEGIVMLDDRKLLRRVTLSLAGRLPTDKELATISKEGR